MVSLKRFMHAVALLCFFHLEFAAAVNPLDTSFLEEEPYKKQKQKVDLSSIKTESEMAIVRQAINPVMRFIVGTVFINLPPNVERELMTANGRAVLRRPPVRNNYNRYGSHRISNWRVCGDSELSVNVVFSNLHRTKFWSNDFFFINDGSGWRFDDHREAKC